MIRIRASAPRARAISTSCCSGIDRPRTSASRVDRRADPLEQPPRPLAPLGPSGRDASQPPGSSPSAMFSATVRSGKSAGCW